MKSYLVVLLSVCFSFTVAWAVEPLKSGDAIALVFSIKEDGLDGIYTVAKDGSVNLPLAGRIKVVGKTGVETCEAIRQRYIDDGIYTRLSVSLSESPQKFIPVPNPQGNGYLRKAVPTIFRGPGDFYTPQEKMRLFQLHQLDVRNSVK